MKLTIIMMACIYSIFLLLTALPVVHAQTATVKDESKNEESQMKEEKISPEKLTPALRSGADKGGPNPGNYIIKDVTPDSPNIKKESLHPGGKVTVNPEDFEHFKVKENSPPPGSSPKKKN